MEKDHQSYIKLKNKKNILFTIGSFYPLQKGGPDNSVYWLTKELSKKSNLKITVLSFYYSKYSNLYKAHKFKPNIKNKDASLNILYFKYFLIRIFSFAFIKFLIFDLKKYEFVVINSFFLKSNWLIALFCNIYNIPFSLSTRGELERGALNTGPNYKFFFVKLIKFFFYRNLSLIFSTSSIEKKYNTFFFKEISNIIIPNYFRIDIKPNIKKIQKKNFLYLGRIHPKKNLELTIISFRNFINKNESKDNLYIYGDGEPRYIKFLKKLVKTNSLEKRVIFKGPIYNKKKYLLFYKFKALVLISKSENFANVVMESLYFGTDVIISNKLPWPKKKFIYKVSLNNINEIENTFKILSNKNVYHSYSASQYIKKNFMSSKLLDQYSNSILLYAK